MSAVPFSVGEEVRLRAHQQVRRPPAVGRIEVTCEGSTHSYYVRWPNGRAWWYRPEQLVKAAKSK